MVRQYSRLFSVLVNNIINEGVSSVPLPLSELRYSHHALTSELVTTHKIPHRLEAQLNELILLRAVVS